MYPAKIYNKTSFGFDTLFHNPQAVTSFPINVWWHCYPPPLLPTHSLPS